MAQLITDMKESLEREIHGVHQEVRGLRDDMTSRFDAQAARLDRQGGLLRAGQTNLVRLNDWSEKVDQLLAARDKRIDQLEARLQKLEKPEGGVR